MQKCVALAVASDLQASPAENPHFFNPVCKIIKITLRSP
jgi:hypothetical protein